VSPARRTVRKLPGFANVGTVITNGQHTMSAALGTFQNTSPEEVKIRLIFFKKLQAVTNKIHATNNVDEIMLDMSQDICDLFNCDRLTIYA
jgi:hypothetical protein